MKNAIIAAGLLFAASAAHAEASAIAEVCNRFMDGNTILRCFQAAEGKTLAPGAAAVCNRFMDGNTIIRCVGAAAGRAYQADEIAVCNRFMDGNTIIRCLETAGREARRERRGRRWTLRSALRECRASNDNDRAVLRCLELLAEEGD